MKIITVQEKDAIIKESIREMLRLNPQFHPTNTLVVTTYSILKNIFVDDIKYVFLEAPTGSGKSVIAYMLHFCYTYINNKLLDIEPLTEDGKTIINTPQNTYLLTSSKMLQEQLDGDIERFNLSPYLAMLKGVKNYECKKLTEETKQYHDYSERFCMGMKTAAKEQLACYDTCEYIQKRFEASGKDCTILNYSYFLNALRTDRNMFFKSRELTIADEAHLIPDIVLDMFNIAITMFKVQQLQKIVNQIQLNFNESLGGYVFDVLQPLLGDCHKIFITQSPTIDDVQFYIENLIELNKAILNTPIENNAVFKEMFKKDFSRIEDDLKSLDYVDYLEDLKIRKDDCFIESEFVSSNVIERVNNIPNGSYKVYKHNVYDLSESALCRKHFIAKVNTCVFMSATLGNIEEFALLMGLEKGEYNGFRLESNFDFEKSPINLVNSGYLNYANFSKNIEKVLFDALWICENKHPNDKGIIHTATFNISNSLKEKVFSRLGGVTNPKRYLFYDNSIEKEACIELMKANTNIPYIIIGPSLYEGIDLKDEQGRFNIIIKTPYSGISNYIRKKMERFPFWYERQTLEKIIQAIGRTNRHPEDWSIIYVLDSVAEKIIFKMPAFMVNRIKYFRK